MDSLIYGQKSMALHWLLNVTITTRERNPLQNLSHVKLIFVLCFAEEASTEKYEYDESQKNRVRAGPKSWLRQAA